MKISVFVFLFFLFISQYSCGIYRVCSTCDSVDLRSAVQKSQNDFFPTIQLDQGLYSGINNFDFEFTSPIRIIASPGEADVVLDCGLHGKFAKVFKNKNFYLKGITLTNCSGTRGGALELIDSSSSLISNKFISNRGELGGAIYIEGGDLQITGANFINNTAGSFGGAIYSEKASVSISMVQFNLQCNHVSYQYPFNLIKNDLYSGKRSNVYINDMGNIDIRQNVSFMCHQSENSEENGMITPYNLCSETKSTGVCPNIVYPQTATGSCGDGNCKSSFESCLTCPSDCKSCIFSGYSLEKYSGIVTTQFGSEINPSKAFSIETFNGHKISNFMNTQDIVAGRLVSYFSVPRKTKYSFKVTTSFLSLNILVDQVIAIQSQTSTISNHISYFDANLEAKRKYKIEIQIYAAGLSSVDKPREFEILYRESESEDFKAFTDVVYSQNVCGDGIQSPGEVCPCDSGAPTFANVSRCGDGICNEPIDDCFYDCLAEISSSCTSASRKGTISPVISVSDDSLGKLVKNQFLWRIPGINNFVFGVDFTSMESGLSPLFKFNYCKGNRLVEDIYRSKVYQIPDEITFSPTSKCSFDPETKQFASLKELQSSYSEEALRMYLSQTNGSYNGYNLDRANGFTNELTTIAASKLSSQTGTSLFYETKLLCSTSIVQLNSVSFHPTFLKDLSEVDNVSQMLQLVQKYGTHYHLRGNIGGDLKQITRVNESIDSNTIELVKNKFGFSISSMIKPPSNRVQDQFNSNSLSTDIISIGGSFNMNSYFGEWVKSIEQVPTLTNRQLAPIFSIIPDKWKTKYGESIKDLWQEAVAVYYITVESKIENQIETVPQEFDLFWFTSGNVVGSELGFKVDEIYLEISQPPAAQNQLVFDQITFDFPNYSKIGQSSENSSLSLFKSVNPILQISDVLYNQIDGSPQTINLKANSNLTFKSNENDTLYWVNSNSFYSYTLIQDNLFQRSEDEAKLFLYSFEIEPFTLTFTINSHSITYNLTNSPTIVSAHPYYFSSPLNYYDISSPTDNFFILYLKGTLVRYVKFCNGSFNFYTPTRDEIIDSFTLKQTHYKNCN